MKRKTNKPSMRRFTRLAEAFKEDQGYDDREFQIWMKGYVVGRLHGESRGRARKGKA